MAADDLHNRDFKKILLIKLSAMGDVVHTFPVLNKLRRRYPKARIDWLVSRAFAELLAEIRPSAMSSSFPARNGQSPGN